MAVFITGPDPDNGLRSIRFEPPVYSTANALGTTLIINESEWRALVAEVDKEMAAESGDYETEPKQQEREVEAWLDNLPLGGDKE